MIRNRTSFTVMVAMIATFLLWVIWIDVYPSIALIASVAASAVIGGLVGLHYHLEHGGRGAYPSTVRTRIEQGLARGRKSR